MAHLPLDDLEFSAARLIPVGEDVESESDGGERVSQFVAQHGHKIVPCPRRPEECARFRDARPLTREMSCANSGFTVLCGTLLRSRAGTLLGSVERFGGTHPVLVTPVHDGLCRLSGPERWRTAGLPRQVQLDEIEMEAGMRSATGLLAHAAALWGLRPIGD